MSFSRSSFLRRRRLLPPALLLLEEKEYDRDATRCAAFSSSKARIKGDRGELMACRCVALMKTLKGIPLRRLRGSIV